MSKKDLRPQGWNFAFVPKDVFLSADLSHADVRVYCYLLWRSGNKDNAWPKVETIAKDLSMSYAAVKLSLKSLIKNNWIRRERNFKGSSTTWIYEKQEDCLTANRLADVGLTGEPNAGLQDSRLKESQSKENQIKRGDKPATPIPPSVTAYQNSMKRYPPKDLWESMSGAIGADPERLKAWETHCTEWRMRGYNITNFSGLFESFQNGGLSANSNGHSKPAHSKVPVNNRKTGGWINTPANAMKETSK